MHTIPEILLWLFTINLGISVGAGIYEKRIVLPIWFIKSPGIGYRVNIQGMLEIDSGRKFWAGVNTVPLTLLTIASLIISVRSNGTGYHWWLMASLITLIERVATFSYFIPAALNLSRSENLPEKKISNLISSWLFLNHFRILFTLGAWIIALKALSLS